MEIKSIILKNELIGYYFYFTKVNNNSNENDNNYINSLVNFDEISLDNQILTSTIINKQLKKSSFEDSNIKNSLYLKNIKKAIRRASNVVTSKFNINNEYNRASIKFDKKDMSSLKYSSLFNDSLENIEIIDINENFIPKSKSNFLFNLNDFSFELSKNNNNFQILNDTLKDEAMVKIKNYTEKMKLFESSSSMISSSNSESQNNISNSSLISEQSYQNSKTPKKDSKAKRNTMSEKNLIYIKNIKGNEIGKLTNQLKRNSGILSHDSNHKFLNKEDKKSINNDYYKVKLEKIHFYLYDYNKETVVEKSNENNNISKIEYILKNKNSNFIENYNLFPILSLKNKKENNQTMRNNQEKNQKNTKSFDNKANESLIENNINEDIKNYKDNNSILYLKIFSILALVILVICGCLNLFLNLTYYISIKEIMKLAKNSMILNYCNILCQYYIKEISLLNFNQNTIIGGEYLLIPSKNRTRYISLLAEKLMDI